MAKKRPSGRVATHDITPSPSAVEPVTLLPQAAQVGTAAATTGAAGAISIAPPRASRTGHSGVARNKSRVLVLTTRGITTRFRHFLEDIMRLLPHAKKEPKLEAKDCLDVANEIAELRGCSNILLLEARKRQDLYLWLAASPFGPTLKFHVANVHNMDELGFPGNNLMFSRPLLTFDAAFDESPHMRLAKELLTQTFAAPDGHRRTKPFVDHIIAFYVCDGRIWMRHYQVVDAALDDKTQNKDVESTIVEIGPRLVMTPIKCFASSFAGATLWENDSYISPNDVRRAIRMREVAKTRGKASQKAKRERHIAKNRIAPDPLASVFRS
jgi:ribosome biogenesis protein BRX1